jgi:hypothetical protein
MATMLRTLPCRIPDDWPLRPRFRLWPPHRHVAVLGVLAYFFLLQSATPNADTTGLNGLHATVPLAGTPPAPTLQTSR